MDLASQQAGEDDARMPDAGSPPSHRWGRVAVAALAVLAVAVVLVTTHPWATHSRPTARASRSAQPFTVPAPPEVGRCYTYTYADYSHPTQTGDPVSCTDPRHDAYTVAMLSPGSISLPFDANDQAANAAVAACQEPVTKLTGAGAGVQFSSLLGSVYEPTSVQLAAGQRWLRCDIVEVTPNDLEPLPPNLRNLLAAGPDLRDALCVHPSTPWIVDQGGDPTLGGWSDVASCSDPGAVVAVRAEQAWPQGTPWPGTARARAAAARACAKASLRFVGLPLRPVPPSASSWSPATLCTADVGTYQRWAAGGKPLS